MANTPIAELEARLASASAPPVDPVKHIDALIDLAWELRSADVPRAHALATEARDLATEHAYKLGQARATRTMAMSIHDNEGLKSVFALAEEAKRLFDEAGDGPGRAASRDYLASIHEHIGDLAGGLELALDALSIAREIADPVRQGYALSNIGGILAASGEVDRGVERLKEALVLFEDARELTGINTITSRLCSILKDAGRGEEAFTYAQKCRDVAELVQDEFFQMAALRAMAELEDDRGNPTEAERLYRAALEELTSEVSRNVMGASIQVALGRLLTRRGELADAERELDSALELMEGNSVSIVSEAAAHEALSELHERRGNLSTTVEHLRKAQALRERIAQQDARNKLAQVEARVSIDAAKKDAEIHKLRFVELHGMQSKLVEAERMALLGKLAAGTAHELNTPLGVLRSNAKLSETAAERLVALVEDEGGLGARAAKLSAALASCRETSDEALERIGAIARSFERFSHVDQADFGSFDVREGLNSALALLEPTLSKAVRVERHFENVPAVAAWPRELNHAFMTVLQNAVQAIDGAGVVSVEAGVTDDHLLVRIRDTGRGMSPEQVAHLFDVTWTKAGPRAKMRLGLSAAYTTMQKHGGTMEVQSVLGQGTTITFCFPIPQPSS